MQPQSEGFEESWDADRPGRRLQVVLSLDELWEVSVRTVHRVLAHQIVDLRLSEVLASSQFWTDGSGDLFSPRTATSFPNSMP